MAGEIHRRCKHKKLAAEHLRSALEIFDRLDAPLWSRRASAELARVGLRTASPIELTQTERQVAELVWQRPSNREAAARMSSSMRTVESCLSRVYRKVGVQSRTQLARTYRADSPTAPQGRAGIAGGDQARRGTARGHDTASRRALWRELIGQPGYQPGALVPHQRATASATGTA